MILNRIDRMIPISKLIKFVLTLVVIIQLILIVYNHYTGFYVLSGFVHFAIRVTSGIILSTIAGIIITIPDLLVIDYLNKRFGWNKKIIQRISIQLLFAIIIATIGSSVITVISHYISPYREGLIAILWLNALISSVINIIAMAILEAFLFFNESNQAQIKAKKLEQELSHIRFEVLKNQINPHFMFNSLNVLSGLIEKDTEKAQLFIDEFAHIYRYVLETIEKQVVTLKEELGFVRSYIFLQKIRYGESIVLTIDVKSELLKFLLPPLSLQLVLENAIKHNILSETQPLVIEIFYEDHCLIVKNNIQPKLSSVHSTGLGQINLSKRYQMVSDKHPEFSFINEFYIARLPLIDPDYDERSYN